MPNRIVASVLFNGTNGAILESEGIKSVSRSSTGFYVVELDFAMPSIYWRWGGGCRASGITFGFLCVRDTNPVTPSIIELRTIDSGGAAYDPPEVSFFVIGAND